MSTFFNVDKLKTNSGYSYWLLISNNFIKKYVGQKYKTECFTTSKYQKWHFLCGFNFHEGGVHQMSSFVNKQGGEREAKFCQRSLWMANQHELKMLK